jgi:DNA invertase Pin-like site-specific DNA recombinase
MATVSDRNAGFRSLSDPWADTTTPHGRLMLTVLGGLAEFERSLILARTGKAGAGRWRGAYASDASRSSQPIRFLRPTDGETPGRLLRKSDAHITSAIQPFRGYDRSSLQRWAICLMLHNRNPG